MSEVDSSTSLAVVGGVYRERCWKPFWDEIFGSAGRAATAIARVGGLVTLYTYLEEGARETMTARAALEGFTQHPTTVKQSVLFEYLHGLSTPQITRPSSQEAPLTVSAAQVIRFGMLEGDAIVAADRAVYDPQNVRSPIHFQANGSTARELALVLNRAEATALAGSEGRSTRDLASALIDQKAASVVVIKNGPYGVTVHDGKAIRSISAYRSNRVWKIGSGDVFVAHFGYRWLIEGRSAVESADLASKATAYYCDTQGFPTLEQLEQYRPAPVGSGQRWQQGAKQQVYLAGPFFTLANLWLIEEVRLQLQNMGLQVFSPYHDVGHGSADDVVIPDLSAIDESDLILSICDGMDPGTVFEVGYARSRNKPVVVYCENETLEHKKMMQGSGCIMCDDFVSAIYQALWVACDL